MSLSLSVSLLLPPIALHLYIAFCVMVFFMSSKVSGQSYYVLKIHLLLFLNMSSVEGGGAGVKTVVS